MAALVLTLHGEALRQVCQALGNHHQGLEQAAKAARRANLLSSATAKKLSRLDTAFNLCRHLTAPKAQLFMKNLSIELGSADTLNPCAAPFTPTGSVPGQQLEVLPAAAGHPRADSMAKHEEVFTHPVAAVPARSIPEELQHSQYIYDEQLRAFQKLVESQNHTIAKVTGLLEQAKAATNMPRAEVAMDISARDLDGEMLQALVDTKLADLSRDVDKKIAHGTQQYLAVTKDVVVQAVGGSLPGAIAAALPGCLDPHMDALGDKYKTMAKKVLVASDQISALSGQVSELGERVYRCETSCAPAPRGRSIAPTPARSPARAPPQTTMCKYGRDCWSKDCIYMHPPGRDLRGPSGSADRRRADRDEGEDARAVGVQGTMHRAGVPLGEGYTRRGSCRLPFDCMVIQGLTKRSELNGQVVALFDWEADPGRAAVYLADKTKISVKHENLRPLAAEGDDPDDEAAFEVFLNESLEKASHS